MASAESPYLRNTSLIVRMPGPADAEAIVRYYQDNRTVLAPFEPRRLENTLNTAFWQARIAQNLAHFHEGRSACTFLFDLDDRTVIGSANLTQVVGYPLHAAVLGYSLAQARWGQGLMHGALAMLLDWAFEHFNLHRIGANHLPDNERSARLLARLGFEREGYARRYLLIDGLWRDHVLTALTRDDWRAQGPMAGLVQNGNGLPSPN